MVARILIIEPHPEVRDLLERVVRRLGNKAIRELGALGVAAVDVCVIEPAAPGAEELMQQLADAGVPIVCVSIYAPTPALRALQPVAYLLKPFTLGDLERAVITATAAKAARKANGRMGTAEVEGGRGGS